MSQPVETEPKVTATETEVEGQGSETQNTNKEWTVEEYKAELAKVRSEAAARRVALREQEEKAKKWSEYEESQKSELQKLQDQLAEKDKAINETKLEATRVKIAKQFNVADEDLDLLTGDEESMKRLAAKLGKESSKEDPKNPADLLAGNRGTPVGGSGNNFTMDDWIRGSAKN